MFCGGSSGFVRINSDALRQAHEVVAIEWSGYLSPGRAVKPFSIAVRPERPVTVASDSTET